MNNEDVIQLNELLSQIEIKNPLLKLLNPKLEFILNPDNSIDLSLRIDTWERDVGTQFLGLESRHPVNNYWKARFISNAKNIASFIRIAIYRTLEHELDESIWCDNKRLFEPKHWGPEDIK